MKRRPRNTDNLAKEAAAFLGGKRSPSARHLMDLIHKVNPTGGEFPGQTTSARYALKARLQSLLIRHCPEDLRVAPVPSQEGVVGLEHRWMNADACHAVIAELDDDARAWVRLQVDLAGQDREFQPLERSISEAQRSGRAPRSIGRESTSAADLIEAGKTAAKCFDFEGARAHLQAAFILTGGDADASVALLELLVDVMADYPAALSLQAKLNAQAKRHPEVRTLLALAAARLGEDAPAAQLVQGVNSPRLSEVLVALTENALNAGDVNAASRHLATARDLRLSHPDLVQLGNKLRGRREAARRPAEEQLVKVVSAGDRAASMLAAKEVLSSWPDSAVARRALRDLQKQERSEWMKALVNSAEEACSRNDLLGAAGFLREAHSLEPSNPHVRERLAVVGKALQAEADDRVVADVRSRFALGEVRSALWAFFDASHGARQRILESDPPKVLGWAEELGASGSGAKVRAAVDGLIALTEAHRAFTEEDFASALTLLSTHEETLRRIEFARTLAREVKSAALQRESMRAEAQLHAAKNALAKGDLVALAAEVNLVNHEVLTGGLKEELLAIREQLNRRKAALTLCEQFRTASERGSLVDARRLAKHLSEVTEGPERADWLRVVERVAAAIREDWRLCVTTCDEKTFATVPGSVGGMMEVDDSHVWVTKSRESVILVTTYERWLFIREISVSTGHLIRVASLRTPLPMQSLAMSVQVDVDSIWITGDEGCILELSSETYDVLNWWLLSELVDMDTVMIVLRVPGTRYVWAGAAPIMPATTTIVDLDRWRICRELKGWPLFELCLRGDAPAVVMCKDNHGNKEAFFANGQRAGATVHIRNGNDFQANAEEYVHFSGETGIAAVTRRNCADGGRQLVVLTAVSPSEEVCRVSVPGNVVIATDPHAKTVVAIAEGDEGATITVVGATTPTVLGRTQRWDGHPRLDPPFPACATFPRRPEQHYPLKQAVSGVPPSAPNEWEQRISGGGIPFATPVAVVLALRELNRRAEGFDLMNFLWDQSPEEPELALLAAEIYADVRDWAAVECVLRSSRPDPKSVGNACHYFHLLGTALFHQGDRDGAISTWKAGHQAKDDPCFLELCICAATPLPVPLSAADWGFDRAPVRQLLGAIATADACFERAAVCDAIMALERWAVLESDEIQSAARLAEAHLLMSDANGVRRFRKRVALASFGQLFYRAVGRRSWSIDVGAKTWSEDRLRDVAARAYEWLNMTETNAGGLLTSCHASGAGEK